MLIQQGYKGGQRKIVVEFKPYFTFQIKLLSKYILRCWEQGDPGCLVKNSVMNLLPNLSPNLVCTESVTKFYDGFGDKFSESPNGLKNSGDKFGESPNMVTILLPNLSTNLVSPNLVITKFCHQI